MGTGLHNGQPGHDSPSRRKNPSLSGGGSQFERRQNLHPTDISVKGYHCFQWKQDFISCCAGCRSPLLGPLYFRGITKRESPLNAAERLISVSCSERYRIQEQSNEHSQVIRLPLGFGFMRALICLKLALYLYPS